MQPSVWVDDSNPIYRRGLISSLETGGFTITGESAALDPEPDLACTAVLVLDVGAISPARAKALAEGCGVRLVGLLHQPRAEQLYELLTAGLAGVLDRAELTPSRLTTCVRAVIEGNGTMPPELLAQLLSGLAKGAPRGALGHGLASREISVLSQLAEGRTTREIALALAYSERTVKNIVHDMLVKLNCRTRAHAVGLATRQGVI